MAEPLHEQENWQAIDEVQRMLRRYHRGELQFDEHLRPLKYVILHDGRVAAPVMVAMLQAHETVLFIPAAEEGALEVLVTLEQFSEDSAEGGEAADRWKIYHGRPDDVRWAFLHLDAAKYRGHVIDGVALMQKNPLAKDEPAICRAVNTELRDRLPKLIERELDADLHDPIMVGVDPLGFDVRGKFNVARIESPEPWTDREHAEQAIRGLIEPA